MLEEGKQMGSWSLIWQSGMAEPYLPAGGDTNEKAGFPARIAKHLGNERLQVRKAGGGQERLPIKGSVA